MADDAVREVKWWSPREGLQKRFGPQAAAIVISQLGSNTAVTLPESAIDRLIEALLELKVLMKDGSTYNSGALRLAVLDGSGIEATVAELNDNGRHNVHSQAQQLIAEIEETRGAHVD